MMRSAARAGIAATVCLVTGALAAQTPQQRPPVFRVGTNLVTVDAYPRRDGRVVEGLTRADFEVLEDGAAQAIDQFEFVRVEPVPEAERVDPNTQREMLQLASDPHNRVFVTYLDTYHVGVVGSHDIRGPLVDMLNRIVAPNDLFGVTTPKMPPSSLTLGRKMVSVEDQLTRYWPWGERNRSTRDPDDPKEDYLNRCFGSPIGKPILVNDDGVQRELIQVLIDRRRELDTLTNFRDTVTYVGSLREARTLVLVITDGWRLFGPDPTLVSQVVSVEPTPIGVGPGGRLGMSTTLNSTFSEQACNAEIGRLATLDDRRLFKDIIDLANRTNVTFYPVNPGGLEVFDTDLAQSTMPAIADMDRHRMRVDSALTLAANTDGIAVTGTNDLRAGLARIVNDVSAYYLLGYYSTNSKADGKYRQIKVRVKQKDVAVAARRGYVASVAPKDAGTAVPAAAPATAEVSDALGVLSRIGAGNDLFTYGIASGKDVVVVAELASGQMEMGKWPNGGTMKVVVTGPAGEPVGTADGRIEPGARGALVRVPFGAVAGPWRVGVTVTGSGGSFDDRLDVRPSTGRLLADPLVYRGGVGPRSVLRPAAQFLFQRTERVHVEFPALKPLDRRTARVLDQRGRPLAVEATLTERDDAGQAILVADLSLAQLSAGDYVLDVSVGSGAESQRRQVAIRVVR